jgi:hypothetical protein
MTDDDLDRALFALPLEEPPGDLHQRILAATVLRPAPVFAVWERWLLALAILLTAAVTVWMFGSTPGSLHRLGGEVVSGMRALGLFNRATYVWLAVGVSSVWWISSLNFMPTPSRTVYNR